MNKRTISLLTAVVFLASMPPMMIQADSAANRDPLPQAILGGVRRVCFIGDSLTDGSAWTDWVMETLAANGYPGLVKQDAGIAGDTVPKLKARFVHDVLDLQPDLAIFNIGTNDREPVEEYKSAMDEMVTRLRQSDARVLLCIPPGICDPKDPTRDARLVAYGEALRELAAAHGCKLADMHAAFTGGFRSASAAEQTAVSDPRLPTFEAARTNRVMWGPDGVHHTINGWRAMARVVLDALGCKAPLIEKVNLQKHMLLDWHISPPVPWKANVPLLSPPVLAPDFDPAAAGWRKYDREAEVKKTSWWQMSWLERGGVMPMGQDVVPGRPGAASNEAGAFALAIVNSDAEKRTVLRLGGSPGYAVWFNGALLWECKFLRGYHPDADRFPVVLRKGANHVLVFSNWLFYAGLGDE